MTETESPANQLEQTLQLFRGTTGAQNGEDNALLRSYGERLIRSGPAAFYAVNRKKCQLTELLRNKSRVSSHKRCETTGDYRP